MKIGIPVAAYHPGNPAEFLARALQRKGHEVTIMDQWQWFASAENGRHDLYLAVDSGGALNFTAKEVRSVLSRTAFWDIDYRNNKGQRAPTDLENVRSLNLGGGWVFQAQYEDFLDCLRENHGRTSWLRLAADPDTWFYKPDEQRVVDVGFIGNVWDAQREAMMTMFERAGITTTFHIAGRGQVWGENAARLLNKSKIGFNISSFFGDVRAYDVNMRVFETLSCGLVLITNEVPSLKRVYNNPAFVRTYRTLNEAFDLVKRSLDDYRVNPQPWLEAGAAAAAWSREFDTYDLRLEQMWRTLQQQGMVDHGR